MSANRMRDRLAAGDTLLGLCNMYPAPGIIEGMGAGYDFVWIDGQHGQMAYDALLNAVRAATVVGIDTLIRVPGHDESVLGPVADMHPNAVMIPMVDTPEQAKQIVRTLRFPPLGNRSYGSRRAVDLHGRDYHKDPGPLTVAQVETLDSARNARAIIATEGIDALFFGPDDMKVRMGLPINTPAHEHPRLRDAMQVVATAAKDAGKWAGTVAVTPEAFRIAREMGYRFLIGGGDAMFLRTLAASRLAELRPLTTETPGGAASASSTKAAAPGLYGA